MQWLEKIRNKPREEKIKLIWIIAAIVVIILVAVWIFAGKYNAQKQNKKFFNEIGEIFEKTKETTPDFKTPANN